MILAYQLNKFRTIECISYTFLKLKFAFLIQLK